MSAWPRLEAAALGRCVTAQEAGLRHSPPKLRLPLGRCWRYNVNSGRLRCSCLRSADVAVAAAGALPEITGMVLPYYDRERDLLEKAVPWSLL